MGLKSDKTNGTDIYLEGVTKPEGLLPCPFCGREPGYLARASEHTDSGEFHALMCYCGGFASTAHQSADSQAEAVVLWNGRPPAAATAAQPVAWTAESWLKSADGAGHFVTRPHPSFPVALCRADATPPDTQVTPG